MIRVDGDRNWNGGERECGERAVAVRGNESYGEEGKVFKFSCFSKINYFSHSFESIRANNSCGIGSRKFYNKEMQKETCLSACTKRG